MPFEIEKNPLLIDEKARDEALIATPDRRLSKAQRRRKKALLADHAREKDGHGLPLSDHAPLQLDVNPLLAPPRPPQRCTKCDCSDLRPVFHGSYRLACRFCGHETRRRNPYAKKT